MQTAKPLTPLIACLAMTTYLAMTACTATRYGELKARSKDVQHALVAERDATLAQAASPEGMHGADRKLNHLSSLRSSLTITDLGLAATRRLLPEADRPLAYDAIEQAYDTIEWNIPLLPGVGTRPMPDAFTGGSFDINRFMAPATNSPPNPIATPRGFAD